MFPSLSRRRLLALLVLTALLLVTLDRRGNPIIDGARRGFALVLRPFDIAAEAVSRPINNAWYGITHYDDLRRENQALQDQIDRGRGAVIEAETAKLEYANLLKLNRLTGAGRYPSVVARVTGDAPGNFLNTVEIDVGTDQGLREGMPVTDGAGMVGKIFKAYKTYSLVLLITDPRYGVTAEVLTAPDSPTTPSSDASSGTGTADTVFATSTSTSTTTTLPEAPLPGDTTVTVGASTTSSSTTTTTVVDVVRETGIVTGTGTDTPLVMSFVDESVAQLLKPGVTVETAGGQKDLAPQGIPIGEIVSVEPQTGSRSVLIKVKPYARLDQLNFVSVLRYIPNSKGG